MEGLDPLMDGILERMEMVTDNSNLKFLQKQAKLGITEQVSSDMENSIKTESQSGDQSKSDAIQRVVDSTLKKIDQSSDTF